MQKLTAMTLGAFLIGLCGYAIDASAQTTAMCPKHEATVFFAPDSSELNKYSTYTVVEMADAARACGAEGVIVEVPTGNARADVVATVLRGKGVKAVIVPAPTLIAGANDMMSRAVVLRVAAPGNRTS
jgi:hypothetical protein